MDLEPVRAQVTFHSETPYWSRKVVADLLFLRIKPHALSDPIFTAGTVYVEWQLKTHYQYTLVNLAGPFAERVGPGQLVWSTFAIIVWRIVLLISCG